MKPNKIFLLTMMLIGWISLIVQLVLLLQVSDKPLGETIIRFFSYFTIQVNLLVAIFTAARFFNTRSNPKDFFGSVRVQTAITLYIIVVGLVYNLVLRSLWTSTGAQAIVHDTLHTVIPIMMLVYWWIWVDTRKLHVSNITAWLIYPAVYAAIVLIRGYFADWYPYPFLDITKLGLQQVSLNSAMLVGVFLFFSILFVYVGRHKPH
ncbi:MAG: hypothetical protein EOO02_11040 [Chitinophagaceae bacterium]|nr:MAG: hypothetical protein EOO02_11040 [Chitinophagaceae bacterium]